MASRKDIEAGKAHVTLYAVTSPLMKGLAAVQSKFNTWGKGLIGIGAGVTALGTSITGALAGAVKIFADSGSELADWSAKTGVAASSLAELQYAAEQSGTDLDTVGKALINMQKKGLDPKRFDEVAAAIAAIPDDVTRTQAALEAFGKAGADLLPMLGELGSLREQARANNIVPTDEAVAAAAKIGDTFDTMKRQVVAAIFEIGAALAPVLQPALDTIVRISSQAIEWVRNNHDLVVTIAKIGAGLAIAGALVTALGVAFVGIGAAIGGIVTAVSTIGTVLAAVFSPLGLIVAAVAAIGVGIVLAIRYWLLFTESGKKALEVIREVLGKIVEGIKGIADALLAGDIGLAAEIAAKTMQVAFFKAIDSIIKKMGDLPDRLLMGLEFTNPFGALGDKMLGQARAAFDVARSAVGMATPQLEKELSALNKKAKDARAKAMDGPKWDDNKGQYGTSQNGPPSYPNLESMTRLRSFGNINTNALFGQKFGKRADDDPAKKGAKFLEELVKKQMPQLIKANKDNQLVYGP